HSPPAFVFAGTVGNRAGSASEIGKGEGGAAFMLLPNPPLGWNSWDGYGTTVTEQQVKDNAKWFEKHLKPSGWQYIVVDMEWFVTNPTPEGNSESSQYTLDAYGRYTPAVNRFPSAADGKGFKPLGDYIHSLGLKFGIHILRGIPKKAVEANFPIAGTTFHAADAADTSETCQWNPDNYGIDGSKPGAQAYYDSIASLYASWGVDFIKVDCISSHPYRGDEIRLLSTALAKTGRPIALSLSPGPAPLEKIDEMRKYAEMWRVSDDIWDIWHSDVRYPQGLGDQFANAIKWADLAQPGRWPDLDMLPLGYLGPTPGWGKARETRLSHAEQRTLVTLWTIFPSPLMVGGDLPRANEWTVSLLTNPEVLAVDQTATHSRPVISNEKIIVWLAESGTKDSYYLAVFNRGGSSEKISYAWKDLGLTGDEYVQRDLWEREDRGIAKQLTGTLESHGSILYKLQRGAGGKQ
ncbi:MAG TPA: glycoside hydrolase family 27 protein, partial [Candidatus Acidoferrum sp.]